MIIGLDAKRANANFTGLGNYSRYIVDTLATYQGEHRYRMYIPKKKTNASYDKLLVHNNVSSILPSSSFMKRCSALWRSFYIKRGLIADGVQLYHGLSNELPIGIHKTGIRSVVTIHDLIFLRYPEFYAPIDRKIYNFKFRYACKVADRVIAVSECTKRDIMKYYHIPAEKIDVVYQGCDERFSVQVNMEEKEEIRIRYNLPEKYILNVGSIESRKNLLLAVKALRNVSEDVHLVAVGKYTEYASQIEDYVRQNGLENRVLLLYGVVFEDLPAIYQLASLFVYPSRFEGFGIPVIEAMSSRIPVIAATGSCLEEAGGPHSLYVDPDDVQGMSDAMNKVLDDESLRRKMIEEGCSYIERFQKDILAEHLNRVYLKCFDKKVEEAPVVQTSSNVFTKLTQYIPFL